MKINNMFKDDINRQINGVIQVEQNDNDVIFQEINEYVVTSELKKHFNSFFDAYNDSFIHPTDNTGVWITGFFGSGKSHFLKMLSYLLANKDIKGKKTVEYFRTKFDDELSFMPIDKATQTPTETILFNIDVEGSVTKDDTAVLRVFANVFYKHLGFYGNDLKVAKLEQFISKQNKWNEFLSAFETKNGESWLDVRGDYAFWEDDIVECLVEVLGMSESAAHHWFDGTETADINIDQLVKEIKEYIDSKPKDFRLLFMIDEAGQYIGTNTSMLLNLQTLIERLGSVCRGQVWIVATGQEALDDMIKVRTDEFSRIMARFAVRLSLTSSSVGEVIEKRLLTKTDIAAKTLETVYNNNDAVIRNLYTFDTEVRDIKGYKSSDEFVRQFPFVPYQFIIMQKVFNEIRKHGHAGKHQSSGERSMLNGFQESAQRIQNLDEFHVVPLFSFYDTLHSFLDTSVRSVVERAEKVAKNNDGLTDYDVNLLKLLYLVRYIDDIKSNVDNISILMADRIDVDKIILKENVTKSLERLIAQNYVSRNGDIYMFLTDEEQDIARDIKNTVVDTAAIINELGNTIFQDIYMSSKYKYNKYDFPFDRQIDEQLIGNSTNGMRLHFMTLASDAESLQELKLIFNSRNNDEAICVLSDSYPYYENMESSLKIKKYIKQKNINSLPDSVQKIITDKQSEAKRLERQAREDITKSIVEGTFYIDGEKVSIPGTDVKAKINKALEILVEHVYYNLKMIDTFSNDDNDIKQILIGNKETFAGLEANKEACNEIVSYLDVQALKHLPTSMYDIQDRYQRVPYGWREIDIAAVVAQLLYSQRITIKYSGEMIRTNDYRLISMLRKKTETGNTKVSKRESISSSKLSQVKSFLREYFNVMDLPEDEDGLVSYIISNFLSERNHLHDLQNKYSHGRYPGSLQVNAAKTLIDNVCMQKGDYIALIDYILNKQDELLDNKDDLKDIDNFFSTQVTLFDSALQYKKDAEQEKDYYSNHQEALDAIQLIDEITTPKKPYNYGRIKELNNYIKTINDAHNELIAEKKKEVCDLIDQCVNEILIKAGKEEKLQATLNNAISDFNKRKNELDMVSLIPLMESKKSIILGYKDSVIKKMDEIVNPKTPEDQPPIPAKKIKKYHRNVIFAQAKISSVQDIDNYISKLKKRLLNELQDADELDIQ